MDFSVVRQMQAFCGNSPFGQVKSHPLLLSEPSQDFVNLCEQYNNTFDDYMV